jgi:hypothetical protein
MRIQSFGIVVVVLLGAVVVVVVGFVVVVVVVLFGTVVVDLGDVVLVVSFGVVVFVVSLAGVVVLVDEGGVVVLELAGVDVVGGSLVAEPAEVLEAPVEFAAGVVEVTTVDVVLDVELPPTPVAVAPGFESVAGGVE